MSRCKLKCCRLSSAVQAMKCSQVDKSCQRLGCDPIHVMYIQCKRWLLNKVVMQKYACRTIGATACRVQF
jgi:hypothetical protein